MTSKRQKDAGWLLPAIIDTNDRLYFCVTIPDTDEYRDAFLGALADFGKWWHWEKSYLPGDERAKQAAQLWRDVMVYSILDNCVGGTEMPSIFRENPLDTCEVQYSNDNGVNWFTMFRKDNCSGLSGGTTLLETEINITTITNNNTTYAGDIINIAPKWAYAAGITDIAMCWAVRKFVDIICDFHIAQLTDNSAWLTLSNFAEKALQLMTAVFVGISASTGQVAVAAGGAAAYALAEIGFDILNAALSNNKEDYEDEDAREIVSCWIYIAIKGATPQFAPWSTALDDFSGGNTAEDAIVSIVQVALGDADLYVNYLLALEDINDVSASLPVCPCPDRWEHYWDFVNFGMENWVIDGGNSYGTYVPGVGVQGELIVSGDGKTSNIIQNVSLQETIPRCDRYGVDWTMVRGYFDTNVAAASFYVPPNPTQNHNQGFIMTGSTGWWYYFALAELTKASMWVRVCNTVIVNYGSITITGMKLGGVGVDPFRHRITS